MSEIVDPDLRQISLLGVEFEISCDRLFRERPITAKEKGCVFKVLILPGAVFPENSNQVCRHGDPSGACSVFGCSDLPSTFLRLMGDTF